MKSDKMMDKGSGDFKGGKFKGTPKGKKRKTTMAATKKPKKKMADRGMPAMMSDQDFGAR